MRINRLNDIGLRNVQYSTPLPDFSVGPNARINILATYGLPFLQEDIFMRDQQRAVENLAITESNHGDISVYMHHSGLYFVRKRFGSKRKYTPDVLRGLVEDYHTHVGDLRRVGIEHISENYNFQFSSDASLKQIEVDQLFFPYGTGLDWLRENRNVPQITERIIEDFLKPILQFTDPRQPNPFVSMAYIDSTLKNFAVLPEGDSVRLYYFDFFVPRVRVNDGSLKSYPGYQLDLVDDTEIEYRYFTKPGILHNFLKRNFHYFFSDGVNNQERQDAWNSFKDTSENLLKPYFDIYFPNMSIEDIIALTFKKGIEMFAESTRRGS